MKRYQCIVCGWIYEQVHGIPEEGITAGTAWEDIPESWTCPDCGVSKADFEMVEFRSMTVANASYYLLPITKIRRCKIKFQTYPHAIILEF